MDWKPHAPSPFSFVPCFQYSTLESFVFTIDITIVITFVQVLTLLSPQIPFTAKLIVIAMKEQEKQGRF